MPRIHCRSSGGAAGPQRVGGAPRPHGRARLFWAIGGGAGAVVLVAAVTGVALLSSSGPYASLPDCDEVFPASVFERFADDPDIDVDTDGGFEYGEEPGVLGSLTCDVGFVADGTERAVSITVALNEPESQPWRESRERLEDHRAELEELLPPGERGELEMDGYPQGEGAWEPLPVGEFGVVTAFTEGPVDARS